jgi:transposase-like protein
MEETSITVTGQWDALSRAVEKPGQTIAFGLTEPRATEAALQLLPQASRRPGLPATLTSDGREAQAAASKRSHEAHGTPSASRQVPSGQKVVAPDPRAVTRMPRPRLGCKAWDAAQCP